MHFYIGHVTWNHIYVEANQPADKIAALLSEDVYRVYELASDFILNVVRVDMAQFFFPRGF